MTAIRNYILLRLVEILAPMLREQVLQEQHDAVLADIEANGLTDADKAIIDGLLNQPQ